MIFTVAVVIVNSEVFVGPKLDAATPVIRKILSRTAPNRDSFELVGTRVVPQSVEEIRTIVRTLVESNSVDWILVVGGTGFEPRNYAPVVSRRFKEQSGNQVLKYCGILY